VLDVEQGLQATAQILDATQAQAAAGAVEDALRVGAHRLADRQVDPTVEGDRRLGRSGTGERGQRGQGEQRFFHCDYLLG
jgi:hypothetical protein